jgi:hypothetical protein
MAAPFELIRCYRSRSEVQVAIGSRAGSMTLDLVRF